MIAFFIPQAWTKVDLMFLVGNWLNTMNGVWMLLDGMDEEGQ